MVTRQLGEARAREEFLTKNARRGRFFEGMAVWSGDTPNKETGKCPTEVGPHGEEDPKLAIEPGQSGPSCARQPGTEGDFATAYGSPRPNVEPMVLQISVACELDKSGGPLSVARAEIAGFSGKY